MSEKKIPQHDKFVRKMFGNPELAADLFENYAEPEAAKAVEWSKLKSLPKQDFGDLFDERIYDLLFTAPLKGKGGNAFSMILTEHKSRPDSNVLLQVGTYLFLAWSRWWKDAGRPDLLKKPLPAPVLIVLYNGKEPWTPPEMLEIVTPVPGLEKYVPAFKVWVIDLTKIDVADIKGAPITRAAVEALKRAGDKTIAKNLDGVLAHFQNVQVTGKVRAQIRDILNYADSVQKLAANQVKKTLDNVFDEKESEQMAQLMLDDIRAEGKIEGEANAVVTFLNARFDDVPETIIEAVQNVKDLKKIDALVVAAAKCQSLKEFEKALKK